MKTRLTLAALSILATGWLAQAATYHFYFNNTEQGNQSTASPTLTVNAPPEAAPSPVAVLAQPSPGMLVTLPSPVPVQAGALVLEPAGSPTPTAEVAAPLSMVEAPTDTVPAAPDRRWKLKLGAHAVHWNLAEARGTHLSHGLHGRGALFGGSYSLRPNDRMGIHAALGVSGNAPYPMTRLLAFLTEGYLGTGRTRFLRGTHFSASLRLGFLGWTDWVDLRPSVIPHVGAELAGSFDEVLGFYLTGRVAIPGRGSISTRTAMAEAGISADL